MNAPEHRLITAVRDLLDARRPAGLPADFPVKADWETAKLERPYLVISTGNASIPHPAMRKLDLVLTTLRRADDETTSPPEELHQRFVNQLETLLPDLITALAAVQLRLRKMPPTATAENDAEGRGDESVAAWTVWLQILPPPEA
jgi:hypothetical protein